jgi:hypothetical protein
VHVSSEHRTPFTPFIRALLERFSELGGPMPEPELEMWKDKIREPDVDQQAASVQLLSMTQHFVQSLAPRVAQQTLALAREVLVPTGRPLSMPPRKTAKKPDSGLAKPKSAVSLRGPKKRT